MVTKKLQSESGESIAEVLVASFVIALGAVLLISMVNASFRIITKQEDNYAEYVNEKNNFEMLQYSENVSKVNLTVTGMGINIEKDINLYSKVDTEKELSFYRYECIKTGE